MGKIKGENNSNTSAGVPTKAPATPAVMPKTAFTKKFGGSPLGLERGQKIKWKRLTYKFLLRKKMVLDTPWIKYQISDFCLTKCGFCCFFYYGCDMNECFFFCLDFWNNYQWEWLAVEMWFEKKK